MPDHITQRKTFWEEDFKGKIALIGFIIYLPFYVIYKILKGDI